MDAKELRIGNWCSDCEGCNYQVTALSILNMVNFSNGYNPCSIPLTEEWLVKFGFEDNNYTFDLMANRKKLSFGWYARVVSSGVRRGFSMGKYKHIKHVHQLQNLYFALTGKELELTQTQKI
jgi:hypothetical protein